jgi:(p)ppGpp synthase/HD superfamily hydrolase
MNNEIPGSIIDTAMLYGIKCHADTNHMYDGKPYSYHLAMVFRVARTFQNLLPDHSKYDVLASCWVHDCIEDCRQTYNDVRIATNERVADIAYALTNEKGKTRKERASSLYYKGIRETQFAAFVKLCDRIANAQYSATKKSKMLEVYQKENFEFCHSIYDTQYDPMFRVLDRILEYDRIQLTSIHSGIVA